MLVINQEVLPNDNLKMHVLSLVDIDDWSDKCRACGRQSFYKVGPCTRIEKESPDVSLEIWINFCDQIKILVKMGKAEIMKEKKEGLLLDGLKKLMFEMLIRRLRVFLDL